MSEESIRFFQDESNASLEDVSNQTSNGGSHIDLLCYCFL